MTLPLHYWKWYKNFKSMSDIIEVTEKLLCTNAKCLKLDSAKAMISVGAANGALDSSLISKCTPELEHYMGLEPDKPSFDKLSEAMTNFTNIKVSLVNKSIEEWKGPEKPVDLILASHVFYHVTNKLAAAKKLCTWIKPGGSLIIVLGDKDSLYAKLAQEIYQVQGSYVDTFKSLLAKGQFHISYEDKLPYHIQIDSTDEEMVKLNFRYLVQDFPEEQMTQLVAALRKECKGEIVETVTTMSCIQIEKPPSKHTPIA